jgi:hypothetical protein
MEGRKCSESIQLTQRQDGEDRVRPMVSHLARSTSPKFAELSR